MGDKAKKSLDLSAGESPLPLEEAIRRVRDVLAPPPRQSADPILVWHLHYRDETSAAFSVDAVYPNEIDMRPVLTGIMYGRTNGTTLIEFSKGTSGSSWLCGVWMLMLGVFPIFECLLFMGAFRFVTFCFDLRAAFALPVHPLIEAVGYFAFAAIIFWGHVAAMRVIRGWADRNVADRALRRLAHAVEMTVIVP